MPKSLRSPRQQHLQSILIASRKAKGLTQTDVAERLGRPQSFVAKYEGGERRLDLIEFIDVVRALGAHPKVVLQQVLEWEAGRSTTKDPARQKPRRRKSP